MSFTDRLVHGWNAFMNKDPTYKELGPSYTYRPDRMRFTRGNERSIITSVYNRIAIDCASTDVKHIRLDENGRFKEEIDSDLNYCLTVESNIDQTSRALLQDIVMSMFNEGVVAVIPVDTEFNPEHRGGYKIYTLRTGKILEWYPDKIKTRVYNEKTGKREDIFVPKSVACIIENPMYAVMNEPNSTAQRLIRKLALLDVVDEQNGSGKLDMIIQLPYIIKTEARRQQAELRLNNIKKQLSESNLGIAYTDGTEKITQLNRPVENQLFSQIESLTRMLYSQLGLTEEIMNGTADEKVMTNYYNRTIEPIMAAIVLEMKRKFLTKTARTQNQTIMYFRDPFKLVSTSELAELADKFTRNEIMSSNEIRQIVGMKPSDDPRADELVNANISQANMGMPQGLYDEMGNEMEGEVDTSGLDDIDAQLNELESMMQSDNTEHLMHYASQYYDPVKAHEYYEMYTKRGILKGREAGKTYTTSRLNDRGKATYKQVKEAMMAEKKKRLAEMRSANKASSSSKSGSNDQHREAMKSELSKNNEAMKKEIDSHNLAMHSKITSLETQIRALSKNPNPGRKAYLQDAIKKLRQENANKRQQITKSYNVDKRQEIVNKYSTQREKSAEERSTKNKLDTSNITKEYKEKLFNELKSMIDSGEFKKTSSSKKSSKRKSVRIK